MNAEQNTNSPETTEDFPVFEISGLTEHAIDRCVSGYVVSYLDDHAQEIFFKNKEQGLEVAVTLAIVDIYNRYNWDGGTEKKREDTDEQLAHYVALACHPASKIHFLDLITTGKSVSDAVCWSILNDFLIDAINHQLEQYDQQEAEPDWCDD